MNGTYMVNAETGTKTRLAPRKATMLPVDGCQVQFGNVVCKVRNLYALSRSAFLALARYRACRRGSEYS